jgi:hypothetical protein
MISSELDLLYFAALSALIILLTIKKQKTTRAWVRKWIALRPQCGAYHQLMKELENEDPDSFSNFIRMEKSAFDQLLSIVRPYIEKSDTEVLLLSLVSSNSHETGDCKHKDIDNIITHT